ncbi:MAG: nickel pincer cofactor biosynthesis protein LarB [Desulfovibrionaceae bacterium]|nr:nickel pincer cofactor biosynthesis protein LarB [Desulfovibrionaceae bacterium]
MSFDDLLDAFQGGRLSREELKRHLVRETFADLGAAKIDHHRQLRTNHPEVVFCQGKTPDQVVLAFVELARATGRALGTRADAGHLERVSRDLEVIFDPLSRLLIHDPGPRPEPRGKIVVVSAGTSDLPVAEEAAQTAEFLGSAVVRHLDCGVAGVHRLLAVMDEFCAARAVIAVAGMDGALASVVSGVCAPPVIAVPTSVGYGSSFGGLAALLTMLNSCAPGVGVVNIDNGFGAGYLAHVINMQGEK